MQLIILSLFFCKALKKNLHLLFGRLIEKLAFLNYLLEKRVGLKIQLVPDQIIFLSKSEKVFEYLLQNQKEHKTKDLRLQTEKFFVCILILDTQLYHSLRPLLLRRVVTVLLCAAVVILHAHGYNYNTRKTRYSSYRSDSFCTFSKCSQFTYLNCCSSCSTFLFMDTRT